MACHPRKILKLSVFAVVFPLVVISGGNSFAGVDADAEKAILSTFAEINRIPRCSKGEDRISTWLVDWAKTRALSVVQDRFKNVVITVPATPGWEDRPGLVLQSHMDMVCLKTEKSTHDFSKDPIPLIRDGGWIRAKDTTLGADDGIGIAIALTLADRTAKPHPRLELLFTADEEKDMTGASGLGGNLLTGTRFINLDSENDAVLTLGAAGGMHTELEVPLAMSTLPEKSKLFKLNVSGLLGGHSGVDINKNRASANVLIAHLLEGLGPFRLVSLNGGTAGNAIATWAEAVIATGDISAPSLKQRVAKFAARTKRQYPRERSMSIKLTRVEAAGESAASEERSYAAVKLIVSLPQGVTANSSEIPGLPESSNNIGIVRTSGENLEVSTFQRSFHSDNLKEISAQIASTAKSLGAASSVGGEFPAWPPRPSTDLARAVQDNYMKLFGTPMAVQIIHAGLECGNIAVKYPALEMVSIGPSVRGVHSTNEQVKVASLRKIWRLLEAVMQSR